MSFTGHLTSFNLPNQCKTQPGNSNFLSFNIDLDIPDITFLNMKLEIGYLLLRGTCYHIEINNIASVIHSLYKYILSLLYIWLLPKLSIWNRIYLDQAESSENMLRITCGMDIYCRQKEDVTKIVSMSFSNKR